jgi:phosphate transport system permease protein
MITNQAKQCFSDNLFKVLTVACATLVIVLMVGFFIQLFWHSMESINTFGFGFLFSSEWDPVRNLYGAASSIYGTLVTTAIAMLIAVPLSFVIALFLVEMAHPVISKIMGQAIDLLAAIPSIIYGMWGLFVFVPFMQDYIQPFLADTLRLKHIFLFRGPAMGFGLMTAGIILALMILPFICAVMRDVFKMVPPVVKESAYGTGATTWEVTFDVTMKYGIQGLLGAVFLGLGRAIGETMAVMFIIGNTPDISVSLFGSGNTISSTLANNFAEAEGLFQSVLFELGLILLVITFMIQVFAQMWLNKVRKSAGGGL